MPMRQTDPSETLTIEKLRLLSEVGSVQHAELVGVPGGWTIEVQVGMRRRAIKPARGSGLRLFKSVDAALSTLRDVGIRRASIDQAGYVSGGV